MLPPSSKYYYISVFRNSQAPISNFGNFVISHKENPRRLAGVGWKEDEILMDGTNGIQRFSGTAQIMREMMEDIILNQQASMYGMADALKDVSSCAANALSTGISDSIQMTSNISGALIDSMIQSLLAIAKELQNVDYATIAEETLETFKELEPFIPDDEKENFKELVEPQKENKQKIFTKEKAAKLLAIIISALITKGVDIGVDSILNKHDEGIPKVQIENHYNIEISVEKPQLKWVEDFFEKALELPDGRKLVLEIKRDGKIEGKNDSVDDSAAQSWDTNNPQHNGDNDCKNNPD